jgi:hypothetical protein
VQKRILANKSFIYLFTGCAWCLRSIFKLRVHKKI